MWRRGRGRRRGVGARPGRRWTEVTIPELLLGLPAYYVIAPAEASSNLSRYDGVRYGLRVDGPDAETMNARTRGEGFGAEVKRRIMMGTYALSAGYYDAYYGQAQKARTLVIRAFEAAYKDFDVLLDADDAVGRLPLRVQGRRPDRDVHVRPVLHPVQPGRPSGRQRALRLELRGPAHRRAGARPGPRGGGHDARGGEPGGGCAPRGARTGDAMTEYETVVGLEVHCELSTATKLFCGCRNAFGDEPNTNICPVCLGLPGSLPVLNRRAVELALRIGAALNCSPRSARSSTARTTSIPTCRRTTRSASTTSRSTSTGGWSCPTGRASASNGPTWKRTRARRPTSAAAAASTRPATRWSTTTARACRSSRSSPARHPLGRPGQGLCRRAALDPRGHGSLRRPHGGGLAAGRRQRLGAPRGLDRVRDPVRGEEPELVALAGAGRSTTRCNARSR